MDVVLLCEHLVNLEDCLLLGVPGHPFGLAAIPAGYAEEPLDTKVGRSSRLVKYGDDLGGRLNCY